MKATKFFIFGAMVLTMASCSTSKENKVDSEQSSEEALVAKPYSGSIAGEWNVTDIEISDSISLKPAEINSEEPTTVMFTDSTYHFQTNCNLVQGDYTQSGDSISFAPGLSTRMACPDMRIEDAISILIPQITGISEENDSTLRFVASNPSSYMIIQKINK